MEEVAELNLRNATLEKKVLRLENENAILRNGCADKASSDLSNTVSVAYTNADVRAKYQPAVQSFLEPLRQYNVKTKYLHTARPCKFLLWVTFVGGGRLPDSLPEFDKFAEQAGTTLWYTAWCSSYNIASLSPCHVNVLFCRECHHCDRAVYQYRRSIKKNFGGWKKALGNQAQD